MSDLPATLFVLYGATGDLAKRMVLPAFFDLYARGLLPQRWKLVGNGRGDVSHEDFRGHVHDVLTEFGTAPTDEQWAAFAPDLLFAGGGFRKEDGGALPDLIEQTRGELGGDAQLIHYLAVPPSAFAPTTEALKEHGLAAGTKVVYEKPYGTSLDSFRALDTLVHSVFDEEQVYRIDHFLGKEATQNLHMLRFANTMIGDVWNREHIEAGADRRPRDPRHRRPGRVLRRHRRGAGHAGHPSVPGRGRGGDGAAAVVRAEDLQVARESVIAAFRPLDPAEVVLGQFDGYRQTEGIAADSTTDTYVAAQALGGHRPLAGRALRAPDRQKLQGGAQRVALMFRAPDGPLHSAGGCPKVLAFDLEGSGRILMELTVKKPGPDFVRR